MRKFQLMLLKILVMSCWIKLILLQFFELFINFIRFPCFRWIFNVLCYWQLQRFFTFRNIFNVFNVIVTFMLEVMVSRRSSTQSSTSFRGQSWFSLTHSTSSRCFWINFRFQSRRILRSLRLWRIFFIRNILGCWWNLLWRCLGFFRNVFVNNGFTDTNLLGAWRSSWWLRSWSLWFRAFLVFG